MGSHRDTAEALIVPSAHGGAQNASHRRWSAFSGCTQASKYYCQRCGSSRRTADVQPRRDKTILRRDSQQALTAHCRVLHYKHRRALAKIFAALERDCLEGRTLTRWFDNPLQPVEKGPLRRRRLIERAKKVYGEPKKTAPMANMPRAAATSTDSNRKRGGLSERCWASDPKRCRRRRLRL